jgi:hypothetical protein
MEELTETTLDLFADRGWSVALYERVNRVWLKVGVYEDGVGPYEDGAAVFADFLAPTPPADAVIRAFEAESEFKPTEFEVRMYDDKFLIASVSWNKEVIEACVKDYSEREIKTVQVTLLLEVDKDHKIDPEYDTEDAHFLIDSSQKVLSVEIKEVANDNMDLSQVQ